jgi:hypothetical protein
MLVVVAGLQPRFAVLSLLSSIWHVCAGGVGSSTALPRCSSRGVTARAAGRQPNTSRQT